MGASTRKDTAFFCEKRTSTKESPNEKEKEKNLPKWVHNTYPQNRPDKN